MSILSREASFINYNVTWLKFSDFVTLYPNVSIWKASLMGETEIVGVYDVVKPIQLFSYDTAWCYKWTFSRHILNKEHSENANLHRP